MSAVPTPRALGRSVGLSAARRRRSGLLRTVGRLRAPGLHGVHPEEAARAAAAALLQGEVRGAGGRAEPRASTGALSRRPPSAEPWGGPGWLACAGPRGAEAGPARRESEQPAASPRRPPSPRPAAGLRGRLLEKRVWPDGRCHPVPREDVGKAPASLRSRALAGKRTSAMCVLPSAFSCDPHACW